MKTTFKYIGSVILTLALGACNLDQYPYSETAADEYETHADAVNNPVIVPHNGLHAVLAHQWPETEPRSDNARYPANGPTPPATHTLQPPTHGSPTPPHHPAPPYQ